MAVLLALPLVVFAAAHSQRDDSQSGLKVSKLLLLINPTARTVTDESQLRILATAIPGLDVASGAAHGTVTSVTAKPNDTLVDGAVLFQVDGINRIGFASSLPFYRTISSGTEGEQAAALMDDDAKKVAAARGAGI
ncbi:MAG: hypothetical protein AB7O30_06220 [Dehalococcoidia bacterium]